MNGPYDRLQEELDTLKQRDGLSPSDMLDLPPALAAIFNKITRKNGMKLTEIVMEVNWTPEDTQKFLDELIEKGYLRRVQSKQEVLYKIRFEGRASKASSRKASIWSALDSLAKPEEEKGE